MTYSATYTATYGAASYALPLLSLGVESTLTPLPTTLDINDQEPSGVFSRVRSVRVGALVKVNGEWSAVAYVPSTYDEVLGGGRQGRVSSEQLSELVAQGVVSEADAANVRAGTVDVLEI